MVVESAVKRGGKRSIQKQKASNKGNALPTRVSAFP